jgi:uncharacterized lipoprotein YddW (UPF0748 family)
LDWQEWLDQGYVDLIIPRAYTGLNESLVRLIRDWKPAMADSDRFAVGLKLHDEARPGKPSKTPGQVLSEIATAEASGSKGYVLFDFEHLTDEVLETLAAGSSSRSGPPAE